jgi:xylan 1,4-beta-xylosidase
MVAAPIEFHAAHLNPHTSYQLEIHRTGYDANDAYSAYIRMGMPKDLTTAQIAQLNDLTRDLPEKTTTVRSRTDGSLSFTVPMRSNDIVLISLTPLRAKN